MNVRPLLALMLFISTPSCGRPPREIGITDPESPVHLLRRIELPNVSGRIDHLALDTVGGRLFVAEYGNGSVDEVDLASGKVIGRISGLREPQGVAWLPGQQEIAVASGDGSLRFYRAADRRQVAQVNLQDDADNERVDPRSGNLIVGHGSGGLAIVDPTAHRVIRELKLRAHPEAFATIGSRVFINVPNAHSIVIGDLDRAEVLRSLGTDELSGNFPMAADEQQSRIAVAYRFPARIAVLDASTAATLLSASACGDADDIYFDGNRILLICGEGAVELIDMAPGHDPILIRTRRGARTGLVDPDRKRLYVALPARGAPAEIWELSIDSGRTPPRN